MQRECELKIKTKSKEMEDALIKKLLGNGFKFINTVLETDYLSDVNGFLCRKNGLLFRIRHSESKEESFLLFTLKIKGNYEKFQDSFEVETSSNNLDNEEITRLIEILGEATKVVIPKKFFMNTGIAEVVKQLKELGFVEHRMLTQKYRSTYIRGKTKITFDTFPENIGTYIEIETCNEEELFAAIAELELQNEPVEKRGYGDIIKNIKHNKPEIEQRTCVFSKTLFN